MAKTKRNAKTKRTPKTERRAVVNRKITNAQLRLLRQIAKIDEALEEAPVA